MGKNFKKVSKPKKNIPFYLMFNFSDLRVSLISEITWKSRDVPSSHRLFFLKIIFLRIKYYFFFNKICSLFTIYQYWVSPTKWISSKAWQFSWPRCTPNHCQKCLIQTLSNYCSRVANYSTGTLLSIYPSNSTLNQLIST